MEDNINEVFTICWGKLLYGSLITSNAYHTGVVGTQLNGTVNLRTVVLRAVKPDEKQVIFYTDIRSAKMNDLKINPELSWLFYDGEDKTQVRAAGNAIIHHQDELAAEHWGKVGENGRKSYMAIPGPSTGIDHPADGLEHLKEDNTADDGYNNFAVIITRVNYIEWLSLKDSGHRRAEFRLIDNSWKGQWLTP